jgi:amino acid adenylation domain-containing protein
MTTPHASEADIEKIAQFNRTEAAFPDQVTLQALIEAQVEQYPDRPAVICDHDKAFGAPSLTYLELNHKANQLASQLRAAGVARGQVVALLVERSFAMMIGVLGILKAGAAYLPLSTDNPSERIGYMLRDAQVGALLVQESTRSKISFAGLVLDLDDPRTYQGSTDNPSIVNTADDLAYVIYTSGSTGKPKGVMIEHRGVVNRLHWMQHAYPIDERDVILQKTPYYFDVSVWELFWWVLQGARLCFLAPGAEGNPLAIVKTIHKHQVTVMHFVPSMLNIFLEYLNGKDTRVWDELASVRRVFASGEALTPSHARKFNDLWGSRTGVRLTNLYGPTEATVDVTYYDCPPQNDFERIPIGRPIYNTRLYVLRDGLQVAIGEAGDLFIAGVGLARGYLNNAVLTAERFSDNPVKCGERIYRTGDIARWLPDGNIEYLGREDHQVKIRGLRIELGEIENTIRGFSGVIDCVTIVKRFSDTIVLIIAYVVCTSQLDFDDLKQHLKKHLPPYMVPNHFQRLDKLPLTQSGKADRNALPDPSLQGGFSRAI